MNIIGSETVESSGAGMKNIIENAPADWTLPYKFRVFKFYNETDCTVIVNGSNPIFIMGNMGFESHSILGYPEIYEFIIVEAGINYNYYGIY